MHSMTYGNLPSKIEFEFAFDWECQGSKYVISNHRVLGHREYSGPELWELLVELVNAWNYEGDEEAGELASSILETLGFEWI